MMWQSGSPYEVVCDGCQTTCDGCSFEEPPSVPMCTAAMEHAFSAGGTDTLEVLSIERGYWRATPSSDDVLACYNVDACLGGVTGTSGYCLVGYEGPCKSHPHTPTGICVCRALSNECLDYVAFCVQCMVDARTRLKRPTVYISDCATKMCVEIRYQGPESGSSRQTDTLTAEIPTLTE